MTRAALADDPVPLDALVAERLAVALPRAVAALEGLADLGYRAWVTGSLAKGTFGPDSDVDFVVDFPVEATRMVFRTIEDVMDDIPFDLVPFRRIRQASLLRMMEGAVDAGELRARLGQARPDQEGVRPLLLGPHAPRPPIGSAERARRRMGSERPAGDRRGGSLHRDGKGLGRPAQGG
jgi:predicted nucleotidyltransferase